MVRKITPKEKRNAIAKDCVESKLQVKEYAKIKGLNFKTLEDWVHTYKTALRREKEKNGDFRK